MDQESLVGCGAETRPEALRGLLVNPQSLGIAVRVALDDDAIEAGCAVDRDVLVTNVNQDALWLPLQRIAPAARAVRDVPKHGVSGADVGIRERIAVLAVRRRSIGARVDDPGPGGGTGEGRLIGPGDDWLALPLGREDPDSPIATRAAAVNTKARHGLVPQLDHGVRGIRKPQGVAKHRVASAMEPRPRRVGDGLVPEHDDGTLLLDSFDGGRDPVREIRHALAVGV